MKTVKPIAGHVMLVDDQPVQTENGIIVSRSFGCSHLDFIVAGVNDDDNFEFGQGDRVVISDPNVGKRVMIDGVTYRMVSADSIIATAG